MKPLFIAAITSMTLALTACGTTGTTAGANKNTSAVGTATAIGMNVFKTSVNNRCRSELQQQQMWRLARIAMTPQQEIQVVNKVCGCVSEKAPQYVTVVDLTNAALDPAYRTQVVAKVVGQTLQACYADLVK